MSLLSMQRRQARSKAGKWETQVRMSVQDFSFDDLSFPGLRGNVSALRASADLPRQTGHLHLHVQQPRYQAFKGESFHAEATLADGVARLQDTQLVQAGSTFDIDGEYHIGSFERTLQGLGLKQPAAGSAAAAASEPEFSERAAQGAAADSDTGQTRGVELAANSALLLSGDVRRATELAQPAGPAEGAPASQPDDQVAPDAAWQAAPANAQQSAAPEQQAAHAGTAVSGNAERPAAQQMPPQQLLGSVQFAETRRMGLLRRPRSTAPNLVKVPSPAGLRVATVQASDAAADAVQHANASPQEGMLPPLQQAAAAVAAGAEQSSAAAAGVPEAGSAPPEVARVHAQQACKLSERARNAALTAHKGAQAAAQPALSGASQQQPQQQFERALQHQALQAAATEPAVAAQQPESERDDSWWLRLRADAQLQDLLPAMDMPQQSSIASHPLTDAGEADSAAPTPRRAASAKLPPSSVDGFAGAQAPQRPAAFGSSLDFGSDGLSIEYDAMQDPAAAEFDRLEARMHGAAWSVGDKAVRAAQAQVPAPPQSQRMPALADATGSLKGEVTAQGGSAGTASMDFDVGGLEWVWGPVKIDSMALKGRMDEQAGMQLERCEVKVCLASS